MQSCSYNECANAHEEYLRIKPMRRYLPIDKDDEFLEAISDLATDECVCESKNFAHHASTNCYQHQISVAYYTFKMCKALKLNAIEAARGALLHDLFLYDWHDLAKKQRRLHPFLHPKKALENAKKHFELTPMQEDIIVKHMWPLTIALPRYRETFIVTIADKMCCVMEVLCSIFKRNTTD